MLYCVVTSATSGTLRLMWQRGGVSGLKEKLDAGPLMKLFLVQQPL
jgi:hypothetical protein